MEKLQKGIIKYVNTININVKYKSPFEAFPEDKNIDHIGFYFNIKGN